MAFNIRCSLTLPLLLHFVMVHLAIASNFLYGLALLLYLIFGMVQPSIVFIFSV